MNLNYGHHNHLFKVPFSEELYFGSHEGCFDIINKKTKLVLSTDSTCNCLKMIPQLVFTLLETSGDYYKQSYKGVPFGHTLLELTAMKVWEYEDQAIDVCDFKEFQYCEDCTLCVLAEPQCISNLSPHANHQLKFIDDWWNKDDIKWASHKQAINIAEECRKSKKTNNAPLDRNSQSYKKWRESILKRDKACQCCGGDKYLEVHHIFGYKDNPSLRETLENGITLCKWCHKKYHSYHGKKANPLDLIKFLNKFRVDFR